MRKHFILLLTSLSALTFFISCKFDNTPKEMDYGGVYFQYPRAWSSETEELNKGAYYITCEQKVGNDIVTMTIINDIDMEVEEYFDIYFDTLDRKFKSLSRKPMEESTFANYECMKVDYTASLIGETSYGSAYGFYIDNKLFFIVTQTDTERRLQNNFELIKSSFKIKESDSEEIIDETIEE